MSFEGALKNKMTRILIQWRGMKWLRYIPFLVNYFILPGTLYAFSKFVDNYELENYFVQLSFLFIPIMSIWWIVLILHEYTEGKGSEVLWIYEKGKLTDVLIFLAMYILSLIPFMLCAMNVLMVDIALFGQMFAQSFFYAGTIYMLAFMFHSVTAAFIPVFAYNLYAYDRIYQLLEKANINSIQSSGYYLFIGIIFFGIGITYHKNL